MALGAKAGEYSHASMLLFPADTTTVTPRLVIESMAVWYEEDTPVLPRLKLDTAGRRRLLPTQSRAAVFHDLFPEPWSPRVFTAYTLALLATPYDLPTAVPATCVP
jgi:hypothetical protein